MASPRETLRTAMQACLQRITLANGYLTNAGQHVTLEPGQLDESAVAVIAVVVAGQARATEPAVQRTHRLTTLGVIVKVPAALDQAQARLDAVVDDVERCMADQQFRFPQGHSFPRYVDLQPIKPEAGMGWVGAVVQYQSNIPIF